MKPKPSQILLTVALSLGALIVVATVVNLILDARNTSSATSASPAPSAAIPKVPEIPPAVYRIAAQFVCTCGACGEKPLESCDCPTAFEERRFIQQQLAAGRSETEAADALQTKYGGRKPSVSPPTENQNTHILNQNTSGIGHLATTADRDHIISHIKCPCNQCAIDELRDCECPHQNGAQEVKRFIDTTINQRQHTVGQIVALVEQRYGGRIR